MSLDLACVIWTELKQHINVIDIPSCAETVVNILVDADYSSDEIKDAFVDDKDVRKVLVHYFEEEPTEDFEEESDESYDPEED